MKKRHLFIAFFFLVFIFQGFSQTITPPTIHCVVDSSSNGNITLYWTNPATNPCGAFVQYTIYASSNGPNGPYNQIAVTNQAATSYTLVNYLATSQTWNFYMEASYNCPGATIVQSDTVNNKPPAVPAIINVDVTQAGHAVFNWQPSSSPQTAYYVIYSYVSGNANPSPLDTVFGRFNTTYTDLKDDPTTQSLTYTISAFDICGSRSAYNIAPHNTIYMTASVTQCQREVKLDWENSPYNNWPQGVKEYQIWVSRNDSAFKMDGTADTVNLTYSYSNFNDGDSLCLVVRAVSKADTTVVSNSNMVCMKASIVQPPAFIYITNVTVDPSNHIFITWNVDTKAQLDFYRILVSNNGIYYNPLDRFNVPVPLTAFQTYVDSTASPDASPYYYEVVAADKCGTQYFSPYGVTVNLKGELADFYVASLTWNEFSLYGATVLKYNIYRDFGTGFQLINSVPDSTGAYTDSLQTFLNEKGTFCYRIETVYYIDLPNGYHDTLTSWSNKQCIIHRPIIYLPNAFAPEGNAPNNIFKPTIIYGDPKGYSLTIYNRWGRQVFASADPTIGWDGNDGGKKSPEGGYGYFMQFTADDGVVVERQGIVLLVR